MGRGRPLHLADVVALGRTDLAGIAATPYLLAAAYVPGLSPWRCGAVGMAGMWLHVGTAVVNDLADREADSYHPRRAERPIVSGRVSQTTALAIACACLAAFAICALIASPSCSLLAALAPVAALQVWGNIRQKRSRWIAPPVMDLLFGLTLAAPMILIPWTFSTEIQLAYLLLSLTLLFDAAALNVMVGNTKDLEHDRQAGDRTTALMLGVRSTGKPPVLRWDWRFQAYSLTLLGLRTVVLILAASAATGSTAVTIAAVAAAASGMVSRVAGVRGCVDHPPLSIAFVATSLLSFLVLSTAVVPPGRALAALVAIVTISVTGIWLRRWAEGRAAPPRY